MTKGQLLKIIKFARPIYKKTGKYHGWDHILAVKRNALFLAQNYSNVNLPHLETACYLHDIGRSIKDEGHNEESAKIASQFLKKIGVDQNEIGDICHAIISHEKSRISEAKTIEAKLLFDADKLEILTVNGFIRVMSWLIEERKMTTSDAINFLWKYVLDVRKNHLQTSQAKKIADEEIPIIKSLVIHFNNWNKLPQTNKN
jgi:uncharacterized protein